MYIGKATEQNKQSCFQLDTREVLPKAFMSAVPKRHMIRPLARNVEAPSLRKLFCVVVRMCGRNDQCFVFLDRYPSKLYCVGRDPRSSEICDRKVAQQLLYSLVEGCPISQHLSAGLRPLD